MGLLLSLGRRLLRTVGARCPRGICFTWGGLGAMGCMRGLGKGFVGWRRGPFLGAGVCVFLSVGITFIVGVV